MPTSMYDFGSSEMDFDDYGLASSESDYECIAQNLTTSFEDRSITKVIGDHTIGKFSSNVTDLTIHMQNTPFLPLNLGAHFPNLRVYRIHKSNVQHLMTGDLNGLKKLKVFSVSKNPIKQLGHEFFNEMSQLKLVDFEHCHLKRIDAEAFDKLINLVALDLTYNDCIDVSSHFEFLGIKKLIKTSCQGEHAPIDNDSAIGCEGFSEERTSFVDVFLTFMIVILLLIAISLAYAVIKIHRGIRQNSWNEMTIKFN